MAAERRAAALVMLAASGCSAAPACENTIGARVPSPDRRHDALVFTRACGATTADSVQLSVVAAGASPENTGNVLIADTVLPRAVAVHWLSADLLSVDLPPTARTFHTADAAEGVRIVYR